MVEFGVQTDGDVSQLTSVLLSRDVLGYLPLHGCLSPAIKTFSIESQLKRTKKTYTCSSRSPLSSLKSDIPNRNSSHQPHPSHRNYSQRYPKPSLITQPRYDASSFMSELSVQFRATSPNAEKLLRLPMLNIPSVQPSKKKSRRYPKTIERLSNTLTLPRN
jgi:hypothetical protein